MRRETIPINEFLLSGTRYKWQSGFNDTLRMRRTWVWGVIRVDTQVVVKTVHSRCKLKWANNSEFGCAISDITRTGSVVVEWFITCPQTDGANRRFVKQICGRPSSGFWHCLFVIYSDARVLFRPQSIWNAPYLTKSHLTGTARAEVPKITCI
jgi:hypothetical protein